jgi:two-component system phosphate regulon sensor histidine kinase PhoR
VRSAQDSTRVLRSFLDVSVALTDQPDLLRVLVVIVERSRELTGARYGAALTLAPDGSIEGFLHRGLTAEQVASLPHLPRGKGLLGLVLQDRAPLRVERISDHPSSVGFPDSHVPMAAFLGVPMTLHGELMGALYLTKPPQDPPFSDEDEELVTAMASMAAVGIQNARLFAMERRRAEASEALNDVAARVRRSLDVDRVLTTTVEVLGRAANVERCFIRFVDGDDQGPLGPVRYEWTHPDIPSLRHQRAPQFPVSSMAALTGTTQQSEDVARDARLTDPSLPGSYEELLALGTAAVLATPLLWGDEVLGVVTFHSTTPRRWSDSDIALIEGASREVATALHHARLYDDALEAAERLRQVDQMRSEFVSTVSHELRSPMTVLAGIADILEHRFDELPADARAELLETLGREARRLNRLVSNVLDVEAADRALTHLRLGDIDLLELAREAIADAGEASRTTLIAEPGDLRARADRDRVKQVMLNLLSNASKFSAGDTGITVTVSPEREDVRISVTDEGPGIHAEEQPLLFQRFSRLTSTASHQPGSGIGLYLCRTIVERHGGQIGVDSVVGRGSTFWFTIPR